MGEISIIGLDLAKQVFQVHCARVEGSVLLLKKITLGQLLVICAKLPPFIVAMEACAAPHYWAVRTYVLLLSCGGSPYTFLPRVERIDRKRTLIPTFQSQF
ncbi:hypothetical protein [Brucella pituitosa]|uniref:hypothetical protein n=1 Tax=Brucella pituitosa TaxID=571256 RepID=UPI001FFD755A|nr:hypothetical protein [Brucella pituitosa]